MTSFFEFTDADWARAEHTWSAWWSGKLERPLVVVEGRADGPRWDTYSDFVTRFPPQTPVENILDYFEAHLRSVHLYGDAVPKWWPNAGPGVLAACLGAELEYSPDTTWFKPLGVSSIAELRPELAPDNFWWGRVQALTSAAIQRWGRKCVVGHTDLGGLIDILASLRGSRELLTDLYDASNHLEQLAERLTRLWLQSYDQLFTVICQNRRGTGGWSPVWAPGKSYMLQCDFAYMISPAMFKRFVMPGLAACCDALDYAFYHLDGKGQIPHLDQLLSLERLRGIQWIPGDGAPPPEDWLPLLRRIREAGKLCQVYVTCSGALKIARELGGRGFLFYIWGEEQDGGHPSLSLPEAERCMKTLAAEGLA